MYKYLFHIALARTLFSCKLKTSKHFSQSNCYYDYAIKINDLSFHQLAIKNKLVLILIPVKRILVLLVVVKHNN